VVTLGPLLSRALDGGDGVVAAMASGFGTAAALVAFLSAGLQRQLGSRHVTVLGMLLMALGLTVAAVAPVVVLAVGGFAVTGGGFILAVTSLTTLLHRRVPDGLRGRWRCGGWGSSAAGRSQRSSTASPPTSSVPASRW
jgi:hypothetical protein